MGGEKDGHLRLAAQPLHRLPYRAARLRVEARRRLVEEEQLGRVDKPARDVRPPPLAAAQLAEGTVENVGKREHPVELGKALFPRPAADAVKGGTGEQVFTDGEPVVEHRPLKDDAHALLDRPGVTVEIEPADMHAALILRKDGAEDVDGRALARSVDAEEGKEAPPLHAEGDALDGLRLAV